MNADYTDEDFSTADDRMRSARAKLLANERAAAAYAALGTQIDDRVERKQATLRQLRKAIGLTQQQLADELGMDQGDISRLERRTNVHLSTLIRFIEATGGHLRLTAVYGDTEVDVNVDQLADA